MRTFFLRTVFTVLLLGFLGISSFAQNKTQAYYNSHETEILPDARTAFRNGDYERAMELCRWHFIIVGDNLADALREMAGSCDNLSKRMMSLYEDGKMSEAREAAELLLSINSEDSNAKKLLEELNKLEAAIPETPIPVDTLAAPVVENPVEVDASVTEEPVLLEPVRESSETTTPAPLPVAASQTRLVAKAGLSFIDMKQLAQTIAPTLSAGIYDMGGTPFGLEAGLYFCPGASLFGLDASVVFHAAKSIYPKAGLGFFSCKSRETGTGTSGLCAGLGLTFMLGGHFCIEAGVKYYPEVKVNGTEPVTAGGVTYDFPSAVQVVSGGIAPVVSVGWAF